VEFEPGTTFLDIGSCIGGPARFIASQYDVFVMGIFLTLEFVETARRIAKLVDLKFDFRVGSALDVPFKDE